jgi:hypothetical protein
MARTSKSNETSGSAASILATRDWLEPKRRAKSTWEMPRFCRRASRISTNDTSRVLSEGPLAYTRGYRQRGPSFALSRFSSFPLFRLPTGVDDIIATLARFFTQAPWYYLSWPAVAMVAGTLIGLSKSAVDQLAVVPRTGRGLVGLVTRVAARKGARQGAT